MPSPDGASPLRGKHSRPQFTLHRRMAIGDPSSSGLVAATAYIKRLTTKMLDVLNRLLASVSWGASHGPKATPAVQWNAADSSETPAVDASVAMALHPNVADTGDRTQRAGSEMSQQQQQPLLQPLPPLERTVAAITAASADEARERPAALKKETLNLHRHSVYHERVDKLAFRMHGLLSAEECQLLIATADEQGYDRLSPFREAHRWHSDTLASKLWRALESHMPADIWGCSVIGVSERFIVYKDSPGYECGEYYDEVYERNHDKAVSYVSVWIDLNEAFEGGRLTFMKRARPSVHDVVVEPRTGSATVLQHNILYQRISTLTSGARYTLRTDIMYSSLQRKPRASSWYR